MNYRGLSSVGSRVSVIDRGIQMLSESQSIVRNQGEVYFDVVLGSRKNAI